MISKRILPQIFSLEAANRIISVVPAQTLPQILNYDAFRNRCYDRVYLFDTPACSPSVSTFQRMLLHLHDCSAPISFLKPTLLHAACLKRLCD